MRGMQVDSYGIKIMVPKGQFWLVKVEPVSHIAANILKQEMLSLGADAAVARGVLTGKTKLTACLLMGTQLQLYRLSDKLKRQPFGLENLAKLLSQTLNNYQNTNLIFEAGKFKLNLKNRCHIMGVINLTPDSFSGDGFYFSCKTGSSLEVIADYAQKLVCDGADILDLGGESSRPGAKPVSLKEELRRTIPAIKKIAKCIKVPISIDTSKPEVAIAALENGASIINDITGLKNQKMREAASKRKAGVIIMHMKGKPGNMQKSPFYTSLIDEISRELGLSLENCLQAGIKSERIILDPGIGFGKTFQHNMEILKRLNEFRSFGRPVLVGTSRKAFIGKILNANPQERLYGTIATCVLAALNGASMVRVHDVLEIKQALKMTAEINKT